jgi:anion-transporting  ArsA/GET3 family ATPase
VSRKSWLDHRILVTVGTGGVGKTTLAAALGLAGARAGKRTLVLTIDPARRLADALGIGPLDHMPREIPAELLAVGGVEVSGSLSAMMLDTKRTFDELVERYAPDEEVIAQILANPIYQNLTDALAGSREYSAMEKLFQLHTEGKYDLIVVDTPPASHALNFLDAPRRLTGFLDSQMLRLLFRPAIAMGRTGFRLFRFGSNTVLHAMERITGMEFLRMVSEFLLVFESLWEGFASRAREIEALLRDPACGFVLVVGPDPVQARRAEEFWGRLEQEQIHLVGVALNRVRTWPGDGDIPRLAPEEGAEVARSLIERLGSGASEEIQAEARALVDAVARYSSLARRDRAIRERIVKNLPLDEADVRVVPLFPEDVHALAALGKLSRHLLPGAGG